MDPNIVPWQEGLTGRIRLLRGDAVQMRKLNILMIEEGGGPARELRITLEVLSAAVLFLIFVSGGLVWHFFDPGRRHLTHADLIRAEALASQRETQIAFLEERIQSIRKQMKVLDQYHESLTTIARLATSDEGRSLVGIGGSDGGRVSPRLVRSHPQGALMKGPAEARSDIKDPAEPTFPYLELIGRDVHLSGLKGARWPARGWVCSQFGVTPSPSQDRGGFNKGVHIAARAGAPVRAPASGVITAVEWREGYGNRVVLAHGGGLVSVFSHLDKVYVEKGDRLAQGEVLATAGGSGLSSGPFVRYETRLYGVPFDPRLRETVLWN